MAQTRSPPFAPLVRSSDGLRLARHAERFGRDAFPRVSADEVVQFAVEEALMEKLDRHDRELERKAARERATHEAQRRVHEANARRRQGAM